LQVEKTLTRIENNISAVSIPYSSGKNCKSGLCKSFIFKGLQRQKL